MKYNLSKIIGALACAAFLGMAHNAAAIAIGINDDYYLGSFTPAQPAGNDTERENVQNLIYLFNGSPSFNPLLNGRLFFGSTDGDLIPTPAPDLPGNGVQQNAGGAFTFATLGAEYLLGKYANEVSHVWYVGDLTEVTLPNLGTGLGLSHVTRFEAGVTRVPDSGATLALVGLGALAVGAVRRRLSK
jgi:hypothetical protein